MTSWEGGERTRAPAAPKPDSAALSLPHLEDLIRMTYKSILQSERANTLTYWFLGNFLRQAKTLLKLGEGEWVDYCTNVLDLDENRRRRSQRLRMLYDTVDAVPKNATLMDALGYSPSPAIRAGKARAAARKALSRKLGDKAEDDKAEKEKPAERMTEAEYRHLCAFVDAVGSLQRAVEVTRQGMLRYLKEEQE